MIKKDLKSRQHNLSLSQATQRALTNLALEGIKPSGVLLKDMQALDIGFLTSKEFLAKAIARATS